MPCGKYVHIGQIHFITINISTCTFPIRDLPHGCACLDQQKLLEALTAAWGGPSAYLASEVPAAGSQPVPSSAPRITPGVLEVGVGVAAFAKGRARGAMARVTNILAMNEWRRLKTL